MAGSQLELELRQSNAEAFAAHLARCGVAPVAAKLAVLVFERGERRLVGDEWMMTLTISSRKAAGLLGCSDRAVPQGAATLSRLGWFRELPSGRGKPPIYVLDVAAAASMLTAAQQLDELIGQPPEVPAALAKLPDRMAGCEPVRTSAHQCEPLRTAPRVIQSKDLLNPCSLNRVHTTGPGAHFAEVRTGTQLPYPWARRGGVTDAELVAACREGALELLRHLFDHALAMGWIAENSDDAWLRFLTGCHHCASARLQRRMGRLVTFVKSKLDVTRFAHKSEVWAAGQIASEHRDPLLARRMMATED